MKNIFENAYFGKAYKTRDERKAIYVNDRFVYEPLSHTDVLYAQLVLETGDILEVVKEIGVSNGSQPMYDNLDIVSEWEEPINEEKLDDFARKYTTKNSLLDKIKNFIIKHLKMVLKAVRSSDC